MNLTFSPSKSHHSRGNRCVRTVDHQGLRFRSVAHDSLQHDSRCHSGHLVCRIRHVHDALQVQIARAVWLCDRFAGRSGGPVCVAKGKPVQVAATRLLLFAAILRLGCPACVCLGVSRDCLISLMIGSNANVAGGTKKASLASVEWAAVCIGNAIGPQLFGTDTVRCAEIVAADLLAAVLLYRSSVAAHLHVGHRWLHRRPGLLVGTGQQAQRRPTSCSRCDRCSRRPVSGE